MEDGDADPAVGIDVGVEYLRGELHLGRIERIVLREAQLRDEHSVLGKNLALNMLHFGKIMYFRIV